MKRKQWYVFLGAVAVLCDSALLGYYAVPVVGVIACLIGGLWVGLATAILLGWIGGGKDDA